MSLAVLTSESAAHTLRATLSSLPSPRRHVDGLTIGRLADGDVSVISAIYERLSDRSRELRFLTPMPRLPRAWVRRLAASDGLNRLVLVAYDDGRPVGEGRIARSAVHPDEAEFALTVVDDHQGRGVGRALLVALAVEAQRLGITRLTFDASPQNRPVLGLLASVGASSEIRDGEVAGYVGVGGILGRTPAHRPLHALVA